ncbi:GAF domain-containing protein [Streptomyces sp. TLI_185]|uniref:GAF domain-containing protein n=1 Tax=Streptomyces sp. TLI_185 TaxID=2485151 RepID=UPI00161E2ED4|nr:GAF domain-containing protein [Streptomyces sp. TLI_185]
MRQNLKVWLLHPATGVVLTVALFGAGPAVALTSGTAKWINLFAYALVVTFANAVRVALSSQRAGGYHDAADKAFERVYGSGLLVLESLSAVCKSVDEASAKSALDRLRSSVLETAREACGPYPRRDREKRRSVIYEFNGDALRYVDKRGRREDPRPRDVFQPDVSPERNVVAWVRAAAHDTPSPDILKDVKKETSRGRASGEHYRSFVSIPVYTDDKAYGLLAVDSKDATSFTSTDGQALRMLAVILATGLAHVHSIQNPVK